MLTARERLKGPRGSGGAADDGLVILMRGGGPGACSRADPVFPDPAGPRALSGGGAAAACRSDVEQAGTVGLGRVVGGGE